MALSHKMYALFDISSMEEVKSKATVPEFLNAVLFYSSMHVNGTKSFSSILRAHHALHDILS